MKPIPHSPKQQIDIIAEPLATTASQVAIDHNGVAQPLFLVREQALTIYLNRVEIVTLMTMGAEPAALIVGFLLNQQLIESAADIHSIHVDWSVNAAAVVATATQKTTATINKRIVTSGCGQGTMFAAVMETAVDNAKHLPTIAPLRPQQLYDLLAQLSQDNEVYRKAGGVHSCALCTHEHVIKSVEDVGRHNAVDSLTGFMALSDKTEAPLLMYTTGRLTSEMVIKTAQMGLPIIVSRSGATSMGVDVAESAGITLVARAKGKRFLVLTHSHRIATNH